MIKYCQSPADISCDSGSLNTKFRKGAQAKDEAGIKNDVEQISHPENPHGNSCIAGAPEYSINNKQEHYYYITPKHDASIMVSGFNNFRSGSHDPEKFPGKENPWYGNK
ncbi:hypothetical protein ES705_20320 [subsurface metagenome]